MFYKQSVDFTVSRRVQYRHMILKLTTLKHRKLLLLHNNSSSCMSMVIFKHMRTTVINRIYCDSKSRLNLENACYPADQKLLSSFLLLKNIKIKIYSTLNLTAVLYGCETWRLLREEPRLRVIGNGMLRNVLKPKEQVKGGWIKLHYANLYDWHPVKILTR